MGTTVCVTLRIVVFRGEHIILAEGDGSDDPLPEGYVGVFGTPLQAEDTEETAQQRALACLGAPRDATSIFFVDRLILPSQPGLPDSNELVLVYTCDFCGYFSGIAVKPDKLPANLYPPHAEIIKKADEWRRRREGMRSRLEGIIKDIAGFKEVKNP